jgi:RNA-splicing ligase RtcB
MVTHHGSRKPGALLYKEGMRIAKMFREELSPDTPNHNAWIPSDTDEGKWYWEALQIIREWTKYNHETLHDLVLHNLGVGPWKITDRYWNEHNFVFKEMGLFWHAKGSTPVFNHSWDADWQGRKIIPLNMAEPILIVKNHSENRFGFAPHGAGRNMSRTAFMKVNAGKTQQQIIREQVGAVDARFYSGKPDISELPGAYKSAKDVQAQIEKYQLANVVDRIMPHGCVMAGEQEQFWRKK